MTLAAPALQLQGSLFGSDAPELSDPPTFERVQLDRASWVDSAPGWLRGGDELFELLRQDAPWEAHERPMYDRIVAVPRLTAWFGLDDPVTPAVLVAGAAELGRRYGRDFNKLGCNLYRSGHDSVAWHSDRIGRIDAQPVIGVLTLGGRRPFLMRPKGGGRSVRFDPGSGDLLVMGGATQHRWEHTVPKVARCDPRLSVTFRHGPSGPEPAGLRGVALGR